MKKLFSLAYHTKKSGGEFEAILTPGDVFMSFHVGEDCFGFLCRKADLNDSNLQSSLREMYAYTKARDQEIELKIIGEEKTVEIVLNHFKDHNFLNVKKVFRKSKCEIHFFAETSKLRVALESEVPKASNALSEARRRVDAKIKVLIVDDSKTIRNILTKVFSSDSQFEVVGCADKPSEVEELIAKHTPDVITLDIHMPEMDGVTLLKTIIAPKYHIPCVMISSISLSEGPMVLDALENGAVDYIQKPEMSELHLVTPLILEKVKTAALANMKKSAKRKRQSVEKVTSKCNLDSMIVLGSSTGGTEAIRDILTSMPDEIPPMLIVQHIPAVFSQAFAKRMNDLCPFEVKEAVDGDVVKKNQVLIAPGGKQMKFVHKNGKSYVEINDDDPVNRFKPSVDYLFYSVAKNIPGHMVAIILTGMGKDGAKGMLELRSKGVRTIAQNEESSVVFGMPKEAIEIGAAEFIEPLNEIAAKITALTHKSDKTFVA